MHMENNKIQHFNSFRAVKDAVLHSINGTTADLDSIIQNNPNALVQISGSKNPVFAAVEDYLGYDIKGNEEEEIIETKVRNAINTLDSMFNKIRIRMGSDVGNAMIAAISNHISHTSLHGQGVTLRDLLEIAAGTDVSIAGDALAKEMKTFFDSYDMLTVPEVARERLTHDSTRQERGR